VGLVPTGLGLGFQNGGPAGRGGKEQKTFT